MVNTTIRKPGIPTRIGKYAILSKMGEGGMSSVYKARHPGLDRLVVIKELKQLQEDQAALRFQREARIMMDLRHENIVQVHDYFIERGRRYIVMEYVDGISLESLLERERLLPLPMALLIAREVARALKHAHDRGIIHRDVKPANIMIARSGAIKLTDFGIATSSEDAKEGLTLCGMTLGTPAYMSPEQFTSTRDVSKQADIYSLGITLYEMLCGRRPFPGTFSPEAIGAIRDGRCPKPGEINPGLPASVIRIIRRTMHRKPKRRFRDLQLVIRKLGKRLHDYRSIVRAHEYIRATVWPEKQTPLVPARAGNLRRIRRRTACAVAIVLCLSGIALYSKETGLLRELFQRHTHGALRVRLQAGLQRSAGIGRPLSGRLVLQHTNGTQIRYALETTASSTSSLLASTGKHYLPAGAYRFRIEFEEQLIQGSFTLPTLAEQKTNAGTLCLTYTIAPPRQLPVHVYYRVHDQASGREITAATKLSVYYYGWHEWAAFLRRPDSRTLLVSGKELLFRFDAPGYRSGTERIRVARHQNRLLVETRLQRELPPLP